MGSQPHLEYELASRARGHRYIAGLDEAGRGAWAGPVVAAAVVFPATLVEIPQALSLVRDSKMLTARQRDRCYDQVIDRALAWAVGFTSAHMIDRIGIVPATHRAMGNAVRCLGLSADCLLIDALTLSQVDLPQQAIPKGDRASLSIAAASIVAKVTRDRHMLDLHGSRPQYGFARHKGYGTMEHRLALQDNGITDEHRCSFAPVRSVMGRG